MNDISFYLQIFLLTHGPLCHSHLLQSLFYSYDFHAFKNSKHVSTDHIIDTCTLFIFSSFSIRRETTYTHQPQRLVTYYFTTKGMLEKKQRRKAPLARWCKSGYPEAGIFDNPKRLYCILHEDQSPIGSRLQNQMHSFSPRFKNLYNLAPVFLSSCLSHCVAT